MALIFVLSMVWKICGQTLCVYCDGVTVRYRFITEDLLDVENKLLRLGHGLGVGDQIEVLYSCRMVQELG